MFWFRVWFVCWVVVFFFVDVGDVFGVFDCVLFRFVSMEFG